MVFVDKVYSFEIFYVRKVKHDAFDDIAEAFEQQAKNHNRALNLYDSDDLTGFEKPSFEKAKGDSKPIKCSFFG